MKNTALIKSVFTFCTVFVLMSSSCQKNYFDTQPDNILTIDRIFVNRGQTEKWLAGIYTYIPNTWNYENFVIPYTLTTDELDASNWTNPGINSGALNAANASTKFLDWYESIRKASIFLENIDRNQEIKDLVNGAELIKQYKGEARFLRAYYYWLMMKEVGPVAIAPLLSSTPYDDFQIPRSSWDESVEFVLSEIALSKEDLPLNNYAVGSYTELDNTKIGRINQIIATAVESQILLFHASPLYNGNSEMADFRNLDGKQLISQSYDGSRWERAAEASKAAIDIAENNGKSLFKVNDPDPFRAAFLACRNLFWDGANIEGIWLRTESGMSGWERRVAPRSVEGTGYAGFSVVQRLVDDFRMSDGSSIGSNPAYNENTYTKTNTATTDLYYVKGTNTMYTNREPRFYVDVTFNGAVNPGVPKSGTANARVELFYTGSSGKAGEPRNWPTTGYIARKNIPPNYVAPSTSVARPTMLIRLAELYLNYAEALNESDPGNLDVLRYLNAVRTRGGLPEIETDLGQEKMREEIRLERRIELCYEGHRYFDVRRWKIADKSGSEQGGLFYGMNINEGTSLSDSRFHQRTVAFKRADWQRRYYFLPYGQREMDRNLMLVNLPGY